MSTPWIYFDTSSYLKLIVKESGSEKARKKARESHVISSAILPIECLSALSRRKREGEIGEGDFQKIVKELRASLLSLQIIGVNDDVLKKAEEVTLSSPARALDAVHIGSALAFQEGSGIKPSFVTSDKKQSEAAARVGFKVIFIE